MQAFSPSRLGKGCASREAFTLIEILVVVAIIALLISILLPSMKAAREMARRSACLSNLHQNGVGLTTYSMDSKGLLPMRGHYGYNVKEENPNPNEKATRPLVRSNYGVLYGKYVGRELEIFNCPGYFAAVYENPNWEKIGIHTFFDDSQSQTTGGYMYAAPVQPPESDRQTGRWATYHPSLKHSDPYLPKGVPVGGGSQNGVPSGGGIWNVNYRYWLTTEKGFNVGNYTSYKPPILQALLTDQMIGLDDGKLARNLHRDGLSALYSDMHAKFVKDDKKGTLTKFTITSGQGGAKALYNMWEYFGKNH